MLDLVLPTDYHFDIACMATYDARVAQALVAPRNLRVMYFLRVWLTFRDERWQLVPFTRCGQPVNRSWENDARRFFASVCASFTWFEPDTAVIVDFPWPSSMAYLTHVILDEGEPLICVRLADTAS